MSVMSFFALLLAETILIGTIASEIVCPSTVVLNSVHSGAVSATMQIAQSEYELERSKVGRIVQFNDRLVEDITQLASSNNQLPVSFITSEYPNLQVAGLNLISFPISANSLVVIFNLPGITNLNLSISVLADIYLGNIKFWNDSRLQQTNKGAILPAQQIQLVARSDLTGDTYTFTSALASFDSDWPQRPFFTPNFTGDVSLNWPHTIDHYGYGETGMGGLVLSIPYTIGYLSHVAASTYGVSHADLIGKAGVPISPTIQSLQSSVRYFYNQQGIQLRSPLINAQPADAYPIVWISRMALNYQRIDCCNLMETVGFAMSIFSYNGSLKSSPLPAEMIDEINAEILQNLTCNGANVYRSYLQTTIVRPFEPLHDGIEIWQIVIIFVAILLATSGLLTTIFVLQRRKVEKQEDGKWLVPFAKLQVWETEKENIGSATLLAEAKLKIQQKFQYLHIVKEYEDVKVCLEELVIDNPHKWSRETKSLMAQFRRNVRHMNVAGFFGFTYEGSKVFCVSDFCAKGSIHYVLTTTKHALDNSIKYNMACDVCDGLMFLHHKGIHVGVLNSLSCCIDSHWTAKIKQWQHSTLYKNENLMNMVVFTPFKENLHSDITLINLLLVLAPIK